MKKHRESRPGRYAPRHTLVRVAVSAAFVLAAPVGAFEIDTGNPDLTMRWDNTVRYNLGIRAQSQDPNLLASPNFDDGDRNFSNGSLVTNRFDVLSEFDIVWMRKYGARVSAAAWYDYAYAILDSHNDTTANTLNNGLRVVGQLSSFTKGYASRFSGEMIDAFVFVNFVVVDVPTNVNSGQHTV